MQPHTLETITARLIERNEKNKWLEEICRIFAASADRLDNGPQNDSEMVNRLHENRKALQSELKRTQEQLNEAQSRARAVAEEQYLKTHVVQGLNDEILSLTMQLTLSEEKRKKLQEELGR